MTNSIAARLASLNDVVCLEAQHLPGRDADLNIYDRGRCIPFNPCRVFTVHARAPVDRGHHAHKRCSQLLVCLAGVCEVLVDDGVTRKTIALDRPTLALYVPPSIWAEQRYRQQNAILMVLCDRSYEEDDYIRDYGEFLAFRNGAA